MLMATQLYLRRKSPKKSQFLVPKIKIGKTCSIFYGRSLMSDYNQYCKMIQEQIKIRNSIYLTPIKVKKGSFEDQRNYLQSTLKKKPSEAETIDSPLISSMKYDSSDSELEANSFCLDYTGEYFCCRGQQCQDDHSQKQITLKMSKSYLISNYPEVVLMSPGRRTKSFLA